MDLTRTQSARLPAYLTEASLLPDRTDPAAGHPHLLAHANGGHYLPCLGEHQGSRKAVLWPASCSKLFTFSSGDNLATQTQIITSLPLVARLAQNLGRIPADMSLKDIMAQPKMVAEIGNLKGMVSAEQTGNTSIVQIIANANSSREAKDVANGLADAFVAWSIEEKNRQVIEAKDFIGQQLGQAEIRLKGADDELQGLSRAASG